MATSCAGTALPVNPNLCFPVEDVIPAKVALGSNEIRGSGFPRIVGNSAALQLVLGMARLVAPTNATVLINGETGTGKELIAETIRKCSDRSRGPLVKLNCAAIPFGLLESELFGHEKGAFTGAIAQKAGRFEMADKGTLFLDEVGDIPLALQSKLLRVLQEQEFERLGGTRTHQVDVRLVAATNRDLADMVNRNEFRSDLYYRLNVFPIMLPPLRERREDIPLLVTHFVDLIGRRMGKQIEHIPAETMSALSSYEWPGNIRELQNFIERSVILTVGTILRPPLAELKKSPTPPSEEAITLEEAERDHICKTLEATRWVVSGAYGAAARLGIKRTTLYFRMRKLGISRPYREPFPAQQTWQDAGG
jgi:formate hydrogenlyase transcriptional activator